MAPTDDTGDRSGPNRLGFKDGPYLTLKVERIMLQIAREKDAAWIARLYNVPESFVLYVARKTGFPAATIQRMLRALRDREPPPEPTEPVPCQPEPFEPEDSLEDAVALSASPELVEAEV